MFKIVENIDTTKRIHKATIIRLILTYAAETMALLQKKQKLLLVQKNNKSNYGINKKGQSLYEKREKKCCRTILLLKVVYEDNASGLVYSLLLFLDLKL